MRGRGRARFKGNNSPSPSPGHRNGSSDDVERWGHDRYNPEPGADRRSPSTVDGQTRPRTMATTRLSCQQNSDRSSPVGRQMKDEEQRTLSAGVDDCTMRKSDSRSRNRRPDVQVYVPRARRQQHVQNRTESQDTTEQSPKVTPVRQKKKEIERYVPKGRLEQQNKEGSSSYQSARNQSSTEALPVDKEVAGNSKNTHKKIKVDGGLPQDNAEISTCGFTEQDLEKSAVRNDDNIICDNKGIQTGYENCIENCENIPKYTSKYEDAFNDATNDDYKSNQDDNCLNKEKDFLCDSNNLNTCSVRNANTTDNSTISNLQSSNKMTEPRGNYSVSPEQNLVKGTDSIKDDNVNVNITDVRKDICNEKSPVSTEIRNDTNEICENRDKLAAEKLTGEEQSVCSDESAVLLPTVTSDMGTNPEIDSEKGGPPNSIDSLKPTECDIKSSITDNTVSNIDDGSNTHSDDNGAINENIEYGTKSDKILVNKDSDTSVERLEGLTVDKNVIDDDMELASEENSVIDCTNTCEESMKGPKMESEDPDKTGNLIKQSIDSDNELGGSLNISQSKDGSTVDQSESVTNNIDQSKEEEVDEDSWDTMFDDDGECLDPGAMEELTKTVGKVKIQKSKKINYLDYQPKDKSNFDFTQYEHIIEIYDFPVDFVTRDLITAFQAFMSRGFDLKWVDDTHALGIFSSAIAAKDALQIMHPLLKVCPLSQASKQSQNKARRCTEFLQPYKPRPETSAMAARRLVAGALGLATGVSKEKREMERKQLKEAKAKKRQERQNRENIWEYGKCAMDEES